MYSNLRNLRKKNSISANEMCNLLGLATKAAYYKKENGRVKFTLEEAKKISDYLGETIEAIFFNNKCS